MAQPAVRPDVTPAADAAHPLANGLHRALAEVLDPLPAEADAVLDAAGRCFVRRGVDHTSVPDVAREAKVSRATVYRLLGPVEDMAGLLFARDLERALAALPPELADARGPGPVVDILGTVLRAAVEHPVTEKLRRDEPYLFGAWLPRFGEILAASRRPLVPVLIDGMAAGELRPGDPKVVADAIARLVLAGFLVPPADVDLHLDGVLVPLLDPAT